MSTHKTDDRVDVSSKNDVIYVTYSKDQATLKGVTLDRLTERKEYFLQRDQIGSSAYPNSYSAIFPEVRRPDLEAKHSCLSGTQT